MPEHGKGCHDPEVLSGGIDPGSLTWLILSLSDQAWGLADVSLRPVDTRTGQALVTRPPWGLETTCHQTGSISQEGRSVPGCSTAVSPARPPCPSHAGPLPMNPWAVPQRPAESSSFWDESQGLAMPNRFGFPGVGAVGVSPPQTHLPCHLPAFSAGWGLWGGQMVGARENPGMKEVAKSHPAGELGTAGIPEGWWHLVAGDNEDTLHLNLWWEEDPLPVRTPRGVLHWAPVA